MKLLTKEIEKELEKSPLYSHEKEGLEAQVIVKFFNPTGSGTWLITEGEKQENGDWLLFGYCHLFDWEWGYISLNELKSVKLPYGMTIERDLYSSGKVKDLIN